MSGKPPDNPAAVETGAVPPPRGIPLMRMEWRSLLFMHWRVPAAALRPLVPGHFEIDTFDGSAWVGLVPFTMRDVSPIMLPRTPLRGVTDFHECNVRTYVTHEAGGPGVYFFSLDAASRLAVWGARRFFHLPYLYAKMTLDRRGDEVRYEVDRVDEPRASMRCQWRVGGPLPMSQPGELAHFLTERYALFTADRKGRARRCRILHAPWSLRNAELLDLDDSLVRAAGIEVNGEPLLHHAERLRMRAWRLERIEEEKSEVRDQKSEVR